MIPHSSAGGQPWGPPMRAFNGGPGRFDPAQMPGQFDIPSDMSQLQPPTQTRQPVVVDLTGGFESQDREPPPKRPKLDLPSGSNIGDGGQTTNSGEIRSTPGSAGSRPPLSWRGRPLWSFQAVMSETAGSESRDDNADNSRPLSPPPFPTQPWSTTPRGPTQNTVPRSGDTSSFQKVQTTPYRIETPSTAPILKGESKSTLNPWQMLHPYLPPM